MDVKLEVGETTQHITVETSAVQVNTVSPTLGQVIEQSRLVDIPLNGRNAADLTLLVPGAINLSVEQFRARSRATRNRFPEPKRSP